jgi:hypothetical protein
MSIWRTGVTHAALAAVCLILGLILGGLGPRAELRAERVTAPPPPTPRTAGAQVARLFQGRPIAASTGDDAPAPADTDDAKPDVHPDTDAPANFSKMREAMAVRLAGAKAALAEDADPSADQQADIDDLFANMNDDLGKIAKDFAALAKQRDPTRRDMERFASDTLDILITTEDRFDEILTPEQKAALADESKDPLSYVDPGLVDILKDVDF